MAITAATWQRAAVTVARVGAVALAGVVVTGIPLIWLYRPSEASSLQSLHSLSSSLLLGAAAALLIVAVGAALARHGVGVSRPVAAAAFAVAAVGTVTGVLVAWDELALRAVTIGHDLRGVFTAGDDVRFVIVGDRELSPGSYLAWVLVHVLVVPLAAAAVGWWWWSRRPAAGDAAPQASDQGESETVSPGSDASGA